VTVFYGYDFAKFELIHTLALPSAFMPMRLGCGLKNPNFLNSTFNPHATSLSIRKAYDLLITPISDSKCTLSVMT
jgi:hypothetical protein